MAKKTKLRHLHKIKIHDNRWLVWAAAYLVFVGIALTGYLKVSDINFETQTIAENTFQSWRGFKNSDLGFGLRYPVDWSIEADSDSSVTFVPNEIFDDGVNILVTEPSAEKALRKTLKITEETSFKLGQELAAKIVNDLGNGHKETLVLVEHEGKLYVLRGSDNLVRKVLLTFYFLSN